MLRIRPPRPIPRTLAVCLVLTLCSLASLPAADRSDAKPKPAAAPAPAPKTSDSDTAVQSSPAGELQQDVMDFSDRFVASLWQALDQYIAAEPDVARQVQAQRLKVTLATASMTIAASKDPRANLLDMAVFISAGRWAVDRYWIPDVLGERAAPLRAVYDQANSEIQNEVNRILTPAQRADLRSLIATWKEQGPGPHEITDVRLRNLNGVVLSDFAESASAQGLLASVRRLLGNVNQSLLYGERMMFYIERTPLVLAQQSDLTVDRVAQRFPIATINPDFRQWSDAAAKLPAQLDAMLKTREQLARDLAPQVQSSLESVARITTSLQGTVSSADSLAAKIQQLPFRQEDYAAALVHTASSLEQLNHLVDGLNRLLEEEKPGDTATRADQLARVLDDRANAIANALFYRAAALIALLIGGLLLVLLAARLLFRPKTPTT